MGSIVSLVFELREHSPVLFKKSFVALGEVLNVSSRILISFELDVVTLVFKFWEHPSVFVEHALVALS